MKSVTVLELRRQLPKILSLLKTGNEAIRLTYRGKLVAHLTPVKSASARPSKEDPFYRLGDAAVAGASLTNREIDNQLYGGAKGVR